MDNNTPQKRIQNILSHLLPNQQSNICTNQIHNEELVLIDGVNLTTKILHRIGYNKNIKLQLTNGAMLEVKRSRNMIEKILEKKEVKYGLNTGFGNFASVVIPEDQLQQLQKNLILSHAVGVGRILSVERTRMLFALRLNVLAKGYSGISPKLMNELLERFNAGLVSQVPEKGTVGASGDLAPLAHLVLGFLGIGLLWNPKTNQWEEAKKVLEEFGFEPIVLGPKEGLALINGTQFIASLGSEAIERAKMLCKVADVIGALTLEVLRGSMHPFEPEIHNARPHSGQIKTAQRILALLTHGISEVRHSHENCSKVQDSYTLRCIPQVHGIVKDTVEFAEKIINTELNSATDNPMVFYKLNKITSCGNFHGEYPAKVLDYLAIGVAELGNISERRIARLINNKLSELPDFLVSKGGLNSGFMMAQVTAASLVSENKTLCHPASVDTIETSGSKEDHVSMGGWAAVKSLQVMENVENVLAIELLACCQGLEFLRPLRTTDALESVYNKVREHVKPWDEDRYFKPDIDIAKELIHNGTIWKLVRDYLI